MSYRVPSPTEAICEWRAGERVGMRKVIYVNEYMSRLHSQGSSSAGGRESVVEGEKPFPKCQTVPPIVLYCMRALMVIGRFRGRSKRRRVTLYFSTMAYDRRFLTPCRGPEPQETPTARCFCASRTRGLFRPVEKVRWVDTCALTKLVRVNLGSAPSASVDQGVWLWPGIILEAAPA